MLYIEEILMSENPEGPPQSGGPDQGPPTGGLPPQYSPPPPGASYPAQPQWAAPVAVVPVVRWRVRDHLFVALTVVVAMIVVVGLGFMWFGNNNNGVTNTADQTSTAKGGTAHKAAASAGSWDLRDGAVFLDSNNAEANTIVAFYRAPDGSLKQIGTYQTGGKGSGTVEDTSNGLVVASTQGTVSPQHDVNNPKFLIVPNLGSGTVTVFSIEAHGLKRDSVTITGGLKPASIAVSHGLLYVLQTGEVTNQFVTSATTAIENCTTGQLPSVTGFHIHDNGTLTPIQHSTRLLSGIADSGCTMIGFSPDGKYLYAAERRAGGPDPKSGFNEGRISSFPVDPGSGTLDEPNIMTPFADGLYSFVFSKDGSELFTADQDGDIANLNGGMASSYNVDNGVLSPIETKGVPDDRTDSCWIALTNDNTLAFVSSPFGDNGVGGSISSYRIAKDGSMTLIHSDASSDSGDSIQDNGLNDGILDITLSRDSNYLYGLDGLSGGVFGFKVSPNGSLTFIQKIPEFNVTPLDQGGAGGPNGIAAY
jgi:6-phosphogluconolactonase (cycloisomerase 2 family)